MGVFWLIFGCSARRNLWTKYHSNNNARQWDCECNPICFVYPLDNANTLDHSINHTPQYTYELHKLCRSNRNNNFCLTNAWKLEMVQSRAWYRTCNTYRRWGRCLHFQTKEREKRYSFLQ